MSLFDNYKNFLNEIKLSNSPIILWGIPSDTFLHPCATDICLLFIKKIDDKKTYCISLNHSDLSCVIDKVTLISDLNRLNVNKWVIDKKSFIQLLPVKNLLDFNLFSHLQRNEIIEMESYETLAHKFIYRTKRNCGDLNLTIPYLKHKEMFEMLCKKILTFNLYLAEEENGYKKENQIIIETLTEVESNGIYVNEECFKNHFDVEIRPNKLVYSQYNIYTSTGRPSNHFDGINYAALNKENGIRDCFTSRYGDDGSIILIDYSAFHPRIISHLIDFEISFDCDIYKYLGKMYFGRDITEYDLDEVKRITMRQLYGGVESKYEHIKYFLNLNKYINKNWMFFNENGYVLTPIFNRKITNNHLIDATPNKLFNYILQATETEIALSAIKCINEYLKDRKTKPVLYTYDSLLFDFYNLDGAEVLSDIVKIMTLGNKFPIKVYKGSSYDSIIQIYP